MAVISNAPVLVPPAPPEQALQDIRDIKPPVVISEGGAWIWWVAGILIILAVAWFLFRFWKRKAESPAVVPVTPPHVIAKQRLQQALSMLSDPKAFCTEVSDTIRVYLEERFRFHAPERTTEEFLLELQGTPLLLPDQKQSLGEFLQVCDLVKFARHEPNESVLRELLDAAGRLIDETRFATDGEAPLHAEPVSSPSAAPPPVPAPMAPLSEEPKEAAPPAEPRP